MYSFDCFFFASSFEEFLPDLLIQNFACFCLLFFVIFSPLFRVGCSGVCLLVCVVFEGKQV